MKKIIHIEVNTKCLLYIELSFCFEKRLTEEVNVKNINNKIGIFFVNNIKYIGKYHKDIPKKAKIFDFSEYRDSRVNTAIQRIIEVDLHYFYFYIVFYKSKI